MFTIHVLNYYWYSVIRFSVGDIATHNNIVTHVLTGAKITALSCVAFPFPSGRRHCNTASAYIASPAAEKIDDYQNYRTLGLIIIIKFVF